MADEQNKSTPAPTPFNEQNVPESVKATEDETIRELRDVPIESVPDSKLAPEDQAIKEAESPEEREARRAAEETLNKPIEALEDTVNAVDIRDQAKAAHPLPHIVADDTVLFGYTIPLPLYTVIYVILAAITLLEVGISSFPHSIFTTIPLIICSAAKAVLVMLFYMHLREDSRIFAFAIILPMFIALVASIFLLTVPIKGY